MASAALDLPRLGAPVLHQELLQQFLGFHNAVARGVTALRRRPGIRRQHRPLVFDLAECPSFFRAVPFLDNRGLMAPSAACGIDPPQTLRSLSLGEGGRVPHTKPSVPRRVRKLPLICARDVKSLAFAPILK